MEKKEVVMNGSGIEEIGFPGWPQFNPDTLVDFWSPSRPVR